MLIFIVSSLIDDNFTFQILFPAIYDVNNSNNINYDIIIIHNYFNNVSVKITN